MPRVRSKQAEAVVVMEDEVGGRCNMRDWGRSIRSIEGMIDVNLSQYQIDWNTVQPSLSRFLTREAGKPGPTC